MVQHSYPFCVPFYLNYDIIKYMYICSWSYMLVKVNVNYYFVKKHNITMFGILENQALMIKHTHIHCQNIYRIHVCPRSISPTLKLSDQNGGQITITVTVVIVLFNEQVMLISPSAFLSYLTAYLGDKDSDCMTMYSNFEVHLSKLPFNAIYSDTKCVCTNFKSITVTEYGLKNV